MIEAKLRAIRDQIATLQAQERVLVDLLNEFNGKSPEAPTQRPARQRSPAIKPLVLEFMARVGTNGATSKEVDEAIRLKVPSVAQDTVGSVLSRLKSDGALVYEGDRYYEKRYAPPPRPFEGSLRAVN